MAYHRHSPPARSTVCHEHHCRHSATLPSVSQSRSACSRTDFIPSWLQHVQTSYNDTQEVLRQASPGPGEISWHPNGIPTIHIKSGCDAGRYQSSDLFIQDTPSPSPLADQTCHDRHHESKPNIDYAKEDSGGRKGRSQSKPRLSTPSESSLAGRDIFEKRPRRKTRKDRYNTVKLRDVGTKKRQTKKPSTHISKNRRLRSSREIVSNFKSSAITNPNERITLKPSFIPGLFVNGRSSVPFTDLVFNEIPSPGEGDTLTEREYSFIQPTEKPDGEAKRQDKIEFLANTWRRPKEDCRPPEGPDARNSRATSIASRYDFQPIRRSIAIDAIDAIDDEPAAGGTNTISFHGNKDDGGLQSSVGDTCRSSLKQDSHDFHIRPIYCLSPTTELHFSDLEILNKPLSAHGNSKPEFLEKFATPHQGLETGENDGECELKSGNPAKSVEYEDKGVMVSPWKSQQMEKQKPDTRSEDSHLPSPNPGNYSHERADFHSLPAFRQLQDELPQLKSPDRGAVSMDNRIFEYPAYSPHASERPNIRTEVEDIYLPHCDASPSWYYGIPSTYYRSHPHYSTGSSYMRDFDSSKALTTQPRDACDISALTRPAGSNQSFRLSLDAYQEPRVFCSDALYADDDIPGESLKEYIQRMEREILGPGEPPKQYVDDDSLITQDASQSRIQEMPHTVLFNHSGGSTNRLHEAESKVSLSPSGPGHLPTQEGLRRLSRHYQQLPYPGKSFDREIETELASIWKPNYMH